jgi:hypothetical protein
MDQDVLNAIARWPSVPAVYGWLSLDGRGRWRIHPGGLSAEGGEGETIANTQILSFMSRNYADDGRGCWYFQNGPQRVYVRVDGAPLVVRLADDGQGLQTHTDRAVKTVTAWWLDDAGHLYVQTEHGPGLILDRDLEAVLAQMSDGGDQPMADVLSSLGKGTRIDVRHPACACGAPLMAVARSEIPPLLHFVRQPKGTAARPAA